MILPDVNILIHAHNSLSSRHEAAKSWWEEALSGSEGVGLAWVTILGFIRITTHRGIFQSPLTPAEASSRVEEWLALSHVHIPVPAAGHFSRFSRHLDQLFLSYL